MNGKILTRLFLVVVCAALTFGGSFECRGSTNDDDDDVNRPAQPSQP